MPLFVIVMSSCCLNEICKLHGGCFKVLSGLRFLFFHGTVMFRILHIARSSSSIISFYEKNSTIIMRMEKQGGNTEIYGKTFKKLFEGT